MFTMCQIGINGTFRTECLPNNNAKLHCTEIRRKKKNTNVHIRLKAGVLMAKEKGWSESGQVS